MTKVTRLGFLVALVLSSTLVACERDLSIQVDNQNPPTFRLTGSGRLVFFVVFESIKGAVGTVFAHKDL